MLKEQNVLISVCMTDDEDFGARNGNNICFVSHEKPIECIQVEKQI